MHKDLVDKGIQLMAKQRDEVIRRLFANEISVHSADMFIFR